jgi:pilus assembly protein CpaE
MKEAIRIFIAVDSGTDVESIRAILPEYEPAIHIVGLVEGLEESWNALEESRSDLLAIACSGHSERALFLIEGAVKQRADRPVIVISSSPPNGFVRRVFEAGADDIITLPAAPADVLFALEKAMTRKQGQASASGVALAPMICVLGPKGGTGKTMTACNLAVSMASAGHQVALVDLDLQFGDVGLALGLSPDQTIGELAKSGGSLDAEKLDAYLAHHASGLRVLLAPTRPDHAGLVSVEFLRELYTTLRSKSDYVVVDTPPGFTPEVIASIDSSTEICMVGMLDSLSLKNTKLGLETLELMGYDAERIKLVLNRSDSRVGISLDDVVAIMGRRPDIFVPSDREIPRAVNEGVPIVLAKERSEAARAFNALAALYLSRELGDRTNGRRRRLTLRKGG